MNKIVAAAIAFAPLWVGIFLANLGADWWASHDLSVLIHTISILVVGACMLGAVIHWCAGQYARLVEKFQSPTPPQPAFHDLQKEADKMDHTRDHPMGL